MLNWDALIEPISHPPEEQEKTPTDSPCFFEAGHRDSDTQDMQLAAVLPEKEAKTVSYLSSVPACPGTLPPLSRQAGHDNLLNNKDKLAFVPVVPVVPAKNQGVSCLTPENSAPGGGAEEKIFASVDNLLNTHNVINPSALALVVAACERVGKTPEEIGRHILDLHRLAPGEQVRLWSEHCQAVGLVPWQVVSLCSPGEGKDCGMCANLDSFLDHVEDDARRVFRWRCKLGYQILEYGRATERIMLAPPECESWERFYPGPWR